MRRRLVLIDAVRAFGLGFFAISFTLCAQCFGMGALSIGVLTSVSVLIGIATTQVVDYLFHGWRLRLSLGFAGFAMTATGAIVAFAPTRLWLYPAALLGFLPPLGGQFVAAVVEGRLAQTPSADRTKVFASYGWSVNAAGALGALSASVPHLVSIGETFGLEILALSYSMLGLVIVLSASTLEDRVGSPAPDVVVQRAGSSDERGGKHRSTINRLESSLWLTHPAVG
jgi:hypothetical protein